MKPRTVLCLLISANLALLPALAPAQNLGGGGVNNPSTSSSSAAPCTAFGTTAGTCAQGNDSRITGAVQTVVACTSFAPTDQSGAGLTFTSVSVQYCQYGNMVVVYGTLTYPSTVSASNAVISVPVAVPNQPYAASPGILTGVGNFALMPVPNSSTAKIINLTGIAQTNVTMSLKAVNFVLLYPAS